MTQTYKIERLNWQGIAMEVRYCESWLSNGTDFNTAHLEIEAIEPERVRLPMTETGYRSYFCQHADIMEHGGVIKYVTAWLYNDAKTPAWKTYFESSKQPDLFELQNSMPPPNARQLLRQPHQSNL